MDWMIVTATAVLPVVGLAGEGTTADVLDPNTPAPPPPKFIGPAGTEAGYGSHPDQPVPPLPKIWISQSASVATIEPLGQPVPPPQK